MLIKPGVVPTMGGAQLFPAGVDLGGGIVLGEGWNREGLRTFEWNATTVAVNPALVIKGLVAGGAYRLSFSTTIFTGTGTVPVFVGTAIADVTISATGSVDVGVVAGATSDELSFVITTNATMTRIAIKELYIVPLKP